MAGVTIAGSAALMLLFLELTLRLFFPQPLGISYTAWRSVPTHTPNFDFTRKTDEFEVHSHFNSMGLRDREYEKAKPPHTYRVLALGDSTTAALEVADAEVYTEIVEASLNTPRSATTYEIINAGISGFGTGDALRMLEYIGKDLSPDLVIVQFSLINDLSENLHTRWYKIDDGGNLVRFDPQQTGLLAAAGEMLGRHSHLMQFIRLRSYAFMSRLFGPRGDRLDKIAAHKQKFHALLYRGEGSPDDFVRDWKVTLIYLREIVRMSREMGAQVLVLVRPLDTDMNTDTAREYPRSVLRDFCEEHNLWYLDLTPTFQEKSGGNIYAYRFKVDSHWSSIGHRWASEDLDRFLRERIPIPAE